MKAAPYTYLARFYDRLMDVDYFQWEQYLITLFKKYDCAPETILDLGCGTGNLTIPLAQRGYAVSGVDLSAEMVAVAEAKAESIGLSIPFLVQDMRALALPNTNFDLIFSACDGVNYLLTEDELFRMFRGVLGHLA